MLLPAFSLYLRWLVGCLCRLQEDLTLPHLQSPLVPLRSRLRLSLTHALFYPVSIKGILKVQYISKVKEIFEKEKKEERKERGRERN